MRSTLAQHFPQGACGGHDLHAPLTAADHRRGALRPKVIVVEYADFTSRACRAAEPAVRLLLAANPETVQLVFRHFPIEFAHPLALMAAQASEAAAAQGKFWEMHDALLHEDASLSRAALDRAAQALKLNMSLFKLSLDDEIYRHRIREHEDGRFKSHLHASPEFFVNGTLCDVSFELEHLESTVRAALGRD